MIAANGARGAVQGKVAGPKGVEKKVFSPVRDPLGNSPGGSDISGKRFRFCYLILL
jgi:hypothetical protein